MIYLITAVPGGGKSLRAVFYAEQFLNDGRAVFGNIHGYSRQSPIPGMSPLIKCEKTGRWSGGIGGDWRDTPSGSVVIYDEAQHDFPQRSNSSAVPEIIRAMETHRHTAHDLIIVTQHPNQIDHWLRRLVGRHDHIRRLSGLNHAALISADSVMELPVGLETSAGEKSVWNYPRSLFNAYESATHHTVSRRLPQPVKFLIFLVIVLLLIFSNYYFDFFSDSVVSDSVVSDSVVSDSVVSEKSIPEPSLSVSRLIAQRPVHLRPVVPLDEYVDDVLSRNSLSGCASSSKTCRCWDKSGNQLKISDRICVALMERGFPFSMFIKNQKNSE